MYVYCVLILCIVLGIGDVKFWGACSTSCLVVDLWKISTRKQIWMQMINAVIGRVQCVMGRWRVTSPNVNASGKTFPLGPEGQIEISQMKGKEHFPLIVPRRSNWCSKAMTQESTVLLKNWKCNVGRRLANVEALSRKPGAARPPLSCEERSLDFSIQHCEAFEGF